MNMITDTALLKHHRVDYSPSAEHRHVRTPFKNKGAFGLVLIAVVAVSFAGNFLS
jgi:hypothetical protein